MKKMIYVFLVLLAIILLTFLVGILLPKERVVLRQSTYNASPQEVFDVVTDNAHWQYRSDLKDLVIISTEGTKQIWDEYTKDGQVIRFSTLKFEPYKFYSFSMESKMFYGYWTSTYEATPDGKTIYTATEHISMRNPFTRVLNYLFFNVGKYMEQQQKDIRSVVESK